MTKEEAQRLFDCLVMASKLMVEDGGTGGDGKGGGINPTLFTFFEGSIVPLLRSIVSEDSKGRLKESFTQGFEIGTASEDLKLDPQMVAFASEAWSLRVPKGSDLTVRPSESPLKEDCLILIAGMKSGDRAFYSAQIEVENGKPPKILDNDRRIFEKFGDDPSAMQKDIVDAFWAGLESGQKARKEVHS